MTHLKVESYIMALKCRIPTYVLWHWNVVYRHTYECTCSKLVYALLDWQSISLWMRFWFVSSFSDVTKRDLRFLQCWLWAFPFLDLWHIFWEKCTDVSEEPNMVTFWVINFATLFYLAIYVVMVCILATRPSHKRTLLFFPSSYWI